MHSCCVQVTSDAAAEWGSRQAHLNEMGNFLMDHTDPQTGRVLEEELRRLNAHWAEFVERNAFVSSGAREKNLLGEKRGINRRQSIIGFPVISLSL